MPYIEIRDFKDGLDVRRPAIAGEPGTLVVCENAHITSGGDVEGVKAFDPTYTLPSGTFGLHRLKSKLYVFGSAPTPSGMPPEVIYQRLQHSSNTMTRLIDARNIDGQIYAVAEYDNGDIKHFIDGTAVTEWDTLADSIADANTLADYFAQKLDADSDIEASASTDTITIIDSAPGTGFTITVGAGLTKTTVQANVAETAEVQATGSFTVTAGVFGDTNTVSSVTVNGVELLSAAVGWYVSNDATAQLIRDNINANTTTPNYTATASGATVTIIAAAGTGTGPNGYTVTATGTGLVTTGSINNMSGGVAYVAAQTQIEEVEVTTYADTTSYTITVNGTAYKATGRASGMGQLLMTFKDKMHSNVGSLMQYSALGAPFSWVTVADGGDTVGAASEDTGLGFLNIASQTDGAERINGMREYQGRMAIFADDNIQIWNIDPDPDLIGHIETLPETGTRSPHAIVPYGNTDVFYLEQGGGIRSLRAKNSSNAAYTDDVGTRIDNLVQEIIDANTDSDLINAKAIVEPRDKRLWVAIADTIFVFSHFSSVKVRAWSVYKPGFDVEWMTKIRKRLFIRSGDTIYTYGGLSGEVYPAEGELETTIRLPYLSINKPATNKKVQGIDVSNKGVWDVTLYYDPNDETNGKSTPVSVVDTTYDEGKIAVNSYTTHVSPELRCASAGLRRLSGMVVHFEGGEEK